MIKILIVDDIEMNRILLKQSILAVDAYDVVEAVSGKEAIDLFIQESPDIIFMDIMMPNMDGYEATIKIKKIMKNNHVPIIFLTALGEADALTKALSSGGNDFISKPFDLSILASKLKAHLKIRELTVEINNKNSELEKSNYKLKFDQDLIEHFFDTSTKQSFTDEKFVRSHSTSKSLFNGDVFLTSIDSEGGLYAILGDFTGHGLSAAMGTLPVAMTFFKMTEASASVAEIARELNFELFNLLPNYMFFAATIVKINVHIEQMAIWSGGMQPCYLLNDKGEIKNTIEEQNLPLGVMEDSDFNSLASIIEVKEGDKLYLHSDGIVEAKNLEGEYFGQEKLENILTSPSNDRFNMVLDELKIFTQGTKQADDISWVELNCLLIPIKLKYRKHVAESLDWSLSVTLTEKDIHKPNPIGQVFELLNSLPFVSHNKDVLQLLFFEIYNNALDHSILNLESIDKKNLNLFAEYYEKREERLKNLESATIHFDLHMKPIDGKNYLAINVTDSGTGSNLVMQSMSESKNITELDEDKLHGRGLSIIKGFCENTYFSEDGQTFSALFLL
ncbi:MAG: fused response regulator/phosphatase [Woeseiaceae bacterium]